MNTQTTALQAPVVHASHFVMTSLVIVVVTAFSSQMALPLWVGAIIDDHGLTAERAGTIAAVEYAAVAIVSVLIATRVHRYNLKQLSIIGMVCLLIGNGAATFAGDYMSLMCTRGLAGAGKGLVIAAIFSLAARTENPTKSFAIINGAYTALATIIYLTLPTPISAYGASGAFASLFAVALVGALFLFWVPSTRAVEQTGVGSSSTSGLTVSLSGFLVLIALIMMWTANGSIWTYVERIGLGTGLSLQQVGTILSVAAAVAILGPITAHLLENRFGFRKPIIAGAALKITAALVLCNLAAPAAYILAAPLFVLAALFIVPYLMSLMSKADPAGRLAAAAGGLLTAGSSLGAYLGGVTLTYSSTFVLGLLSSSLLLGVMLLVHIAVLMLDKSAD